ncbi:MAG: Ku protein [Actinomycetota bacterium]
MKTIWKGAISFGLVTIPIRVYSAVEEKSLKFNQLHSTDQGRIKMKRTCSLDGAEVGFDEIVKGFEYEKGHYVVLTEEDLDRGLAGSRTIDVLKFVSEDEIDPILWKSSYYIVPDAAGAKAYALLRTALGEGSLVALVKVAWRDKEHLATLRVKDRCFVLETMYWPDEVREPAFDELADDPEVREQEVQMARMLIDSMTDVFKADEFHDSYREKLESLVAQKIEGKEIAVVEEEGPQGAVIDLMEALRASVEAVSKKPDAATG